MKTRTSLLLTLALAALLTACGSNDAQKDTSETNTETTAEATPDTDEAEAKELVADDVPAPEGFSFEEKELDGLGTLPLPTGDAWTVEDNPMGKTYYNEALGYTVKIQTQNEGFMEQIKDYTNSYHENNLRDAEQYQEQSRTFGKVAGYSGCVITGTFNNGQPHVTKDYLFFTPTQSTVVQTRTLAKNKDKLEPIGDYMVGNLKK
jgi:hypothetical protein